MFQYKPQVASALANLAGWVVHENQDEIRRTLQAAGGDSRADRL